MQKMTPASKFQRMFAAIMDIMLAFLFATLLSSFVVSPIIANSNAYKDNYLIYENGLIATKLYQKDENNSNKLTCIIDLTNPDGSIIFNIEKLEEYDEKLIEFYSNYSVDAVERYQNTKAESNIYIKNESNQYVLTESININDAYNFFATSYIDATKYYFEQNEIVNNAYYYLSISSTYALIIPAIISLLICYIVLPIVFKDGQTIAKKLFSLKVVSLKSDKTLNKGQVVLREMFFVIVELVLSYFTYCIPLIVSVVFMLLNKNHLSFHDYIGQTYVIDCLNVDKKEERHDANIIDVDVKEI